MHHTSPRYEPRPIDTSNVTLGPDVLELIELLARNNHDIWSCQRMADGWRYGLSRDDDRKEHPSLVPYETLPESEREYDRSTVVETLKAIVALGYCLVKKNPSLA